ncbi:glycoside hydrolase family 114 protein [Zasmidium cellare ATCC 36951]|uniref:alpha-galactosidase n=1 Tax=Zasmidium cellare ATCC 36951 TaxID=1080233 RepID=A0A6A6CY66_ZASCE|nr:glycoside hydrolase family 114 protein [Zasmidium cellare ATCC 36951]KAF2172124.1 glycoside hydrolase family 114 protein [Zasmidium cellare ATCC 36951]
MAMAMFLAIAAFAAPAFSWNPGFAGIPFPFHDVPVPWEGHGSAFVKPTAGTTWNIQLISLPSVDQANDPACSLWDFDMEGADKKLIDAFHAKNHSVACYFSAGSWEDFRKDADDFPKEALGKVMKGWENEKWVDTRNQQLRDVIKKRIQSAKNKGCDAIDADNVDGYSNDTGFDLTEDDGVDYVKFLAGAAHDLGMAYGLKNAEDILERVLDVSQFSVQEECVFYQDCDKFQPFIKANKPVFNIEYPDDKPDESLKDFVKESCSDANARGFSQLIKQRDLGDFTETCP